MQTTSDSFLRSCPACGRPNRVPYAHLADEGHCGACQAVLAPQSEPFDVDEATFDAITSSVKVPVLVDFWAQWCGPCRAAAPHVKQVAHDMAGKAVVLKVDTDKYPQLSARYGVQGIPNFVVLKNGQLASQNVGLVDARTMKSWLA